MTNEYILNFFRNNIEMISEEFEQYLLNKKSVGTFLTEFITSVNDDRKISIYNDLVNDVGRVIVLACLSNDETKISYLETMEDEDLKLVVIASLSSDETKISYLETMEDEEFKVIIIASLSSDETKISYLETMEDEYLKARIIASLSSDETKISYLETMEDEYLKAIIIASLSSNETKISYLETMENEKFKSVVISSLSNDEVKIFYLETMKDDSSKLAIIKSLKDESIKIENLKFLKNEELKEMVVSSLSSDEIKMSYLETMENDSSKSTIIKSLKDERTKIESLKFLKNEELKAIIILSLSSDELKISCLEIMEDDYYKSTIIKNFKDEKTKIESLKFLKNEELKATIIVSLSSDEVKMSYLETMEDDYYKSDIIESLKDEKIKIESLKFLKNEELKATIIVSLSSDEVKMSYLETMENDYSKITIIKSLKDEIIKIESLKFLKDEILKARVIASLSSDEFKISYLETIENDYIKQGIIISLKDESTKIESLKLLKNEFLKSQVQVSLSNDNIVKYFKMEPEFIIDKLIHLENEETKSILSEILKIDLIEYLSSKKGLNKKNLEYIVDTLGSDFISYIDNENFKNIINGDIEDIHKICRLLKQEPTTMTDVDTIFTSLLQKRFTIQKAYERSIFNRFEAGLENGDNSRYQACISEITNSIKMTNIMNDKNFMQLLLNNGYSISNDTSLSDLLNKISVDIINCKNNPNKKEELMNVIHEVTNYYIQSLRDQYIRDANANIGNELYLSKTPNKEKQFKMLFKTLSEDEMLYYIQKIDKEKLSDELKTLLSNIDILNCCIQFKKNPFDYNGLISKEELKSKHLRNFTLLLNESYRQQIFNGVCESDEIMDVIPNKTGFNYYNILCNLNYEQLKSGVLINPELYKKIEEIFRKYKLTQWGNTYDKILSEIGFQFNTSSIADFINFSNNVLENIPSNKLSPLILVETISIFGINSYRDSLLFGIENYKFLSNNPAPNSAPSSPEERIKLAKEYYRKMYEREHISIPPLEEEIKINDKTIKISTGDIDPINLTYGERTGACMRIAGVGSTLFDFCLSDDNGFHIKFSDPKTGKFISRVSGFRNGNTIFLNQLRNSCDMKYIDEDLIESLKEYVKKIIELSQNSNMPIENVVISPGYAMQSHSSETICLDVDDVKKGFKNFYSDINKNNAIVLASTGKPILLDINTPNYNIRRLSPVVTSDSIAATFNVNHVNVIESLLCSEEVDMAHIINDVNFSITGEDWYIYVDSTGIIHNRVIDGISEVRRNQANMEMEKYLVKTKEMFGGEHVR